MRRLTPTAITLDEIATEIIVNLGLQSHRSYSLPPRSRVVNGRSAENRRSFIRISAGRGDRRDVGRRYIQKEPPLNSR